MAKPIMIPMLSAVTEEIVGHFEAKPLTDGELEAIHEAVQGGIDEEPDSSWDIEWSNLTVARLLATINQLKENKR